MIVNNYSLPEFKELRGKMQLAKCINRETGEQFKCCVFTDSQNNHCFVGFSKNLGELTPEEIKFQKDQLQIVETDNGHYSLCRKNVNAWEDVDI